MRNIARLESASISRLEELGASRLSPRVDCDIDYEEPAAAWSATLLDLLATPSLAAPATGRPAVATTTIHDKRNPFPATILENIRIVGRHSTKETRHVELDLTGSGLSYQPGDSLGIAATNDIRWVEDLLAATGLSGDSQVKVKDSSLTLAQALATRFEITTASPRFIDAVGEAERRNRASATAAARMPLASGRSFSTIITSSTSSAAFQ